MAKDPKEPKAPKNGASAGKDDRGKAVGDDVNRKKGGEKSGIKHEKGEKAEPAEKGDPAKAVTAEAKAAEKGIKEKVAEVEAGATKGIKRVGEGTPAAADLKDTAERAREAGDRAVAEIEGEKAPEGLWMRTLPDGTKELRFGLYHASFSGERDNEGLPHGQGVLGYRGIRFEIHGEFEHGKIPTGVKVKIVEYAPKHGKIEEGKIIPAKYPGRKIVQQYVGQVGPNFEPRGKGVLEIENEIHIGIFRNWKLFTGKRKKRNGQILEEIRKGNLDDKDWKKIIGEDEVVAEPVSGEGILSEEDEQQLGGLDNILEEDDKPATAPIETDFVPAGYEALKAGEERFVANAEDGEIHVAVPFALVDGRCNYGGPNSKYRDHNEDSMFTVQTESGLVVGVIDIAGGSSKDVDRKLGVCELSNEGGRSVSRTGSSVDDIFSHMNAQIFEDNNKKGGKSVYGCAVVAKIDHTDQAELGWVGDAKIITVRNGAVLPEGTTKPHNVVIERIEEIEQQIAAGKLTESARMEPKDYYTNQFKSIITRQFGDQAESLHATQKFQAQEGDIIILGSDGAITDLVSSYEIQSIVASSGGDPSLIQKRIYDLAYARNNATELIRIEVDPGVFSHVPAVAESGDNITLQVIKFGKVKRPRPEPTVAFDAASAAAEVHPPIGVVEGERVTEFTDVEPPAAPPSKADWPAAPSPVDLPEEIPAGVSLEGPTETLPAEPQAEAAPVVDEIEQMKAYDFSKAFDKETNQLTLWDGTKIDCTIDGFEIDTKFIGEINDFGTLYYSRPERADSIRFHFEKDPISLELVMLVMRTLKWEKELAVKSAAEFVAAFESFKALLKEEKNSRTETTFENEHGTYVGEVDITNRPNGQGKFEYKDGERCEGEFKDGYFVWGRHYFSPMKAGFFASPEYKGRIYRDATYEEYDNSFDNVTKSGIRKIYGEDGQYLRTVEFIDDRGTIIDSAETAAAPPPSEAPPRVASGPAPIQREDLGRATVTLDGVKTISVEPPPSTPPLRTGPDTSTPEAAPGEAPPMPLADFNLRHLLNAQKIRAAELEPGAEAQALQQAKYIEFDAIINESKALEAKGEENIEHVTNEILHEILVMEKPDKAIIDPRVDKLMDLVGLEEGVIRGIILQIETEFGQQAKRKALEKRSWGKTLLKAGGFVGVGVLAGMGGAVGGGLVAGGLFAARVLDNIRMDQKTKREVAEAKKEMQRHIDNSIAHADQSRNDFYVLLAAAKQAQIDAYEGKITNLRQRLAGGEAVQKDLDSAIYDHNLKMADLVYNNMLESHGGAENIEASEKREIGEIARKVQLLYRLDENAKNFEATRKITPSGRWQLVMENWRKQYEAVLGPNTLAERNVTTAVFAGAAFAARSMPVLRSVLGAITGARLFGMAADYAMGLPLKPITSAELKQKIQANGAGATGYVQRARVCLADREFSANISPIERQRLQALIQQFDEEVVRKDSIQGYVGNVPSTLRQNADELNQFRKGIGKVRLGFQAAGAIGGAVAPDVLHALGKHAVDVYHSFSQGDVQQPADEVQPTPAAESVAKAPTAETAATQGEQWTVADFTQAASTGFDLKLPYDAVQKLVEQLQKSDIPVGSSIRFNEGNWQLAYGQNSEDGKNMFFVFDPHDHKWLPLNEQNYAVMQKSVGITPAVEYVPGPDVLKGVPMPDQAPSPAPEATPAPHAEKTPEGTGTTAPKPATPSGGVVDKLYKSFRGLFGGTEPAIPKAGPVEIGASATPAPQNEMVSKAFNLNKPYGSVEAMLDYLKKTGAPTDGSIRFKEGNWEITYGHDEKGQNMFLVRGPGSQDWLPLTKENYVILGSTVPTSEPAAPESVKPPAVEGAQAPAPPVTGPTSAPGAAPTGEASVAAAPISETAAPAGTIEIAGVGKLTPEQWHDYTVHGDAAHGGHGKGEGFWHVVRDQLRTKPDWTNNGARLEQKVWEILTKTKVMVDGHEVPIIDPATKQQLWVMEPDKYTVVVSGTPENPQLLIFDAATHQPLNAEALNTAFEQVPIPQPASSGEVPAAMTAAGPTGSAVTVEPGALPFYEQGMTRADFRNAYSTFFSSMGGAHTDATLLQAQADRIYNDLHSDEEPPEAAADQSGGTRVVVREVDGGGAPAPGEAPAAETANMPTDIPGEHITSEQLKVINFDRFKDDDYDRFVSTLRPLLAQDSNHKFVGPNGLSFVERAGQLYVDLPDTAMLRPQLLTEEMYRGLHEKFEQYVSTAHHGQFSSTSYKAVLRGLEE